MRTRPTTPILLALGLPLLLGGCEDGPGEGAAPPAGEPAAPSPALREAAGVEEPSSAWPEEVIDLGASLEAVESAASCRDRLRRRVPVELAEVLSDIGYDQVLDDLCAGLVAVRDGSVEGCDALGVSALRRGCRRRLALVSGRPELCPDDPTIDGREPVCIAWAARDVGLCRAALVSERDRCRAVLAGDADGCARLLPGDRERCRAQVRRYAAALGQERRRTASATVAPLFRLEAQRTLDGTRAGEPVVVARDVLDRGVHLEARGCGWRLSLREPTLELPTPVSFTDRPAVAEAQLEVPSSAVAPVGIPLGPTTAALRVLLPGIGEATSVAGAQGEVRLTAWTPERGGEVSGEIDAELALTPGRLRVTGAFRTFVRDLEPLAGSCPAPP